MINLLTATYEVAAPVIVKGKMKKLKKHYLFNIVVAFLLGEATLAIYAFQAENYKNYYKILTFIILAALWYLFWKKILLKNYLSDLNKPVERAVKQYREEHSGIRHK